MKTHISTKTTYYSRMNNINYQTAKQIFMGWLTELTFTELYKVIMLVDLEVVK